MARKTTKLLFSAILLLCALGCNQRLKEQARFSVLDSDTACGETSARTLEIDLLVSKTGKRAAIRLNGNDSSWDSLSEILRGLFSVRVEKFVYLKSEPGVNSSDESAVSHLIEDAGAERLCIQDFKAPRKYVPQIIGGTQ